jgi:hypothetical protein
MQVLQVGAEAVRLVMAGLEKLTVVCYACTKSLQKVVLPMFVMAVPKPHTTT